MATGGASPNIKRAGMISISTATVFSFYLTDKADHFTGMPGLTPTLSISKRGGPFVTSTNTVTEISDGWYSVAITAADTDTIGDLIIKLSDPLIDDAVLVVTVNDPVSAIWDAPINTHITAGTFGYFIQKKLLTFAKFIGLK